MNLTVSIFCMSITCILIMWGAFRQPTVKPIDFKYSLPPKTKRKRRTKTKVKARPVDNTQKAAKATLVSFGFSATEAKKMLNGITASTVEQYVQEAMKKVKI